MLRHLVLKTPLLKIVRYIYNVLYVTNGAYLATAAVLSVFLLFLVGAF
jgi:hypothetical protein